MDYKATPDYLGVKYNRLKALEAASKCTPKPAIYIGKGVRGIDLHPKVKPSRITNRNRKTDTAEVIRMHNEGKNYAEIAAFYKVTKQNICYIVLRYNRANGIDTEPPKTKKGVFEETWNLYKEGKTYAEIAKIMNCKKNTVIQRISTYKKRHGK